MGRRANGDGSIYKLSDGRWAAATYVTLKSGKTKRKVVTGHTGGRREEVKVKLEAIREQERKKIPFTERKWTVGVWLDFWLTEFVSKRRRTTVISYERNVRLYIKPLIGKKYLENLSKWDVQSMINQMLRDKRGTRAIHKVRQTLSSALGCAMKEEIIFRNVSRAVEMPEYKPKPKRLWNLKEERRFIEVAKGHPYYIVFLLMLTYGLRKGEALGLRWSDIDFENNIFCVRQQIQDIDGRLQAVDVKTGESERELPLTPAMKRLLLEHALKKGIDVTTCYDPLAEFNIDNLVSTSKAGTPINPHNVNRALSLIIKKTGLPYITPHTKRHMASTLHKNVGTPMRDAQGILGHADSEITRKLYQHADIEIQRRSLIETEKLLCLDEIAVDRSRCYQKLLTNQFLPENVKKKNTPDLAYLQGLFLGQNHGESGGDRTHDTGLKRPDRFSFHSGITPVMLHVRTYTIWRILGAIAIKNCYQFTEKHISIQDDMESYLKLLHICDEAIRILDSSRDKK